MPRPGTVSHIGPFGTGGAPTIHAYSHRRTGETKTLCGMRDLTIIVAYGDPNWLFDDHGGTGAVDCKLCLRALKKRDTR